MHSETSPESFTYDGMTYSVTTIIAKLLKNVPNRKVAFAKPLANSPNQKVMFATTGENAPN